MVVSKLFLRIIHPSEWICLRCNTSPQCWRAWSSLKTDPWRKEFLQDKRGVTCKGLNPLWCFVLAENSGAARATKAWWSFGSTSTSHFPVLPLSGECSPQQMAGLLPRTWAAQRALAVCGSQDRGAPLPGHHWGVLCMGAVLRHPTRPTRWGSNWELCSDGWEAWTAVCKCGFN